MRKSHSNEGHVKADVKELLKKHNWWFWMPPGSAFGTSNVDFNALRTGAFLALETKFGKNKATANQKKFLRQTALAGGIGLIVNEKTLPDFALWLKAYDNACRDGEHGLMPDPQDNTALMRVTGVLTAELNEDDGPAAD